MIEDHKITRYVKGKTEEEFDAVAKEFPLAIEVNGKGIAKLSCSPEKMKELAVGYLFAEGVIKSKADITELKLEDTKVAIELKDELPEGMFKLEHKTVTSGCGKNVVYSDLDGADLERVEDESLKLSHEQIYSYVKELAQSAVAFNQSGGVHSALLKDYTEPEKSLFCEDIGRHNAVDKIIGEMILNGYSLDNKILVVSGRVSSEIMLKSARRKFPILISRSAPTTWSVQLAFRLGVTLIGFVRGKKMNVYTHPWRIE